jgi:hypothetical protein
VYEPELAEHAAGQWNTRDDQAADHYEDVLQTREELLEALKEYGEAFTEFDPENRASRHRMRLAVIKARAAIAKATGAAS